MTKHRRPVVKVGSIQLERPKLVGSCVGQLQILTDIDNQPAIPIEDWNLPDTHQSAEHLEN